MTYRLRDIVLCTFIILLFAAISGSSLAAVTYTDIYFTVREAETSEKVILKPIELRFNNINTGTTINLTEFINEAGEFSYRINIGNWKLIAKIDSPLTPEVDYSAERTILIEENDPVTYETIYIYPVGAVEGSVVDESEKLISNADITFRCKSYRSESRTDQFGSFKQELLPAGQCKVQAAFEDLVGTATVNVTRGELSTAVIKLNKTLLSSTKEYSYVFFIIIGVLLFLLWKYGVFRKMKEKYLFSYKKEAIVKYKKKAKKAEKKAESREVEKEAEKPAEEKESQELNPRARDIMKTLNEREAKVVNSLISQENYKSTQAKIRNETAIPKTSLVRIFQSLEAKNVIKIEIIGKLKKVELTGWFLGKD